MVVEAEDWSVIKAHFKTEGIGPMEELTGFIANSEYRHRFFGTVFLDSLVICAYNPFRMFSYALHISYADDCFKYGWYINKKLLWEEERRGKMQEDFSAIINKVAWF